MTAQPPPYFNESRAIESPESRDEVPTPTKVYKAYWGVLSETLLTWMIAVGAARDTKWYSVRVYSSLAFSSKRYYVGLGKCSAYGDVDYEEFDDACSLTKAARASQILATLAISAVLPMVLYAAISPAPQTGKFGLYAGLMLAVFSVFELTAFSLAASYASKVGGSYDDDSNDSFSLGATFYLAVIAWLLGTAGSIASLVLRKSATSNQDGPLANLATAAIIANFKNVVEGLNDPSQGNQGAQGTQGRHGTQGTEGTHGTQATV